MKENILAQIAELNRMGMPQLKERWKALFGTEPQVQNRAHMVRRLAYRIQELAYGGLSDGTRARLTQVADEDAATARRPSSRKREQNLPVAGTRLVRDWNGERHEVLVARDGFDLRGRRYRSLSAVAKAITGAHRSGPAFFGLKQPLGEKV